MRFLRRSLTGLFLLAVTLALGLWAVNTVRGAVVARMNEEPRSFPQRERVFAVNVTTVTLETIAPELLVFGEVRSSTTLDLRAPVGGTVLWTDPALIEGGTVSAGQPLLRLDTATAQAARDRIAADVQDAEGEVRDAERGVDLSADELAQAQSQVDLRQGALTRASDLASRGVGTQSVVEEAQLALSNAQSTVLTRRQDQAQAAARLDQARTALSRVQIDLAEADRTLTDTTVTAVFDGVLTNVLTAQGARVTANEAIATLIDPARLEVAFRISTAQYARLLQGAGAVTGLPVTVSIDVAGLDVTAQGRVTRVAGAVGEGQTGRQLFAALDDAPGLRPGDFVTVRVREASLDNVARLPATAVAADDTVLIVSAEDRLESRPVTVLRRQGDDVLIAADDLAGQSVVSARTPLLGEGIGVRPIGPAGAAQATEADTTENVALDDARRARLKAFVTDSGMPDDAKARILAQLDADQVPAATVARLESRMGG
ncbi:efflux RND transporter periplasmic adaptor subunit [Loktanella sp. M215]|uniref:efflux RND transporter periplasmic adaptor subunit n=1 Tax=Loktanella sp. M215 TaxID=2675431 RepID=UPI001F4175FB|nr:HlyD family efflux transporter periplasmic adaptor subunit [Loktanella sp. M215]MCF7699245.1 HlyD family efflux transporter periplasmic adaptor subunit [Loktanella sp. M215]